MLLFITSSFIWFYNLWRVLTVPQTTSFCRLKQNMKNKAFRNRIKTIFRLQLLEKKKNTLRNAYFVKLALLTKLIKLVQTGLAFITLISCGNK